MSDRASVVRETFFWICFIWNVFWIPISFYYLYVYTKYRGKSFFRARMSNATIMTVLLALLAMIERLYDGFIGIGYVDSDHMVNLLLTYIQIYPIIGCYIYKYVI